MHRYLIIADDITGANDTGVQLARRGIPTLVTADPARTAGETCSYVLETDSRGMNGAEAYDKLRGLCAKIAFGGFRHVVKKVDSTLRGNIAWEVRAADEAFGSDIVLFMPALPDLGRTTQNAVHMLGGNRILDTELAKDPKKPVTQDCLDKLLAEAYSEKITHFKLADIEAGRMDFSAGRVFTSDAVTNSHMQAVVLAALQTGKRILWVGSAAIADNLLETEFPVLPAMALVSSVSETTRSQVLFAEKSGVSLVIVRAYELMNGKDISGFVRKALGHLEEKKDVIILSSAAYDRDELQKTIQFCETRGMRAFEVGGRFQQIMGEIAARVLKEAHVSGLFLTGGDTAKGFFNETGAVSFRILSEVAAGIPLMRIEGGIFDGMKVITKAGAFGKEDALFYGLRKLKEKDA